MTSTLPNTEYLTTRLAELGITEKENTITRVWNNSGPHGEAQEQKRDYKIFDADEDGNIVIHYFDLHGQPYRWKKEDVKMTPRDFVRRRLRHPEGSMKYRQDAGSPVLPFFTPGLIKKFKAKEEIETLYLVEGEFKAFKGWMNGLDIVGLPGIFGFYSDQQKGKLHEHIMELIVDCKVHKLVILFDADFLSVKWSAEKDLFTRPNSFYGAIKAFRESVQVLLDAEEVNLELVYFMHIESKYMNEAKGLDDLFCKYSSVPLEIVQDLNSLNTARKYFKGFSILDQQKDVHTRVYSYLGLLNENDFYKTYREFIEHKEFKFKRRRYIYNDEKKEVVFVRHEDADKFMRIGPDWVKVITKLNKFGEKEEEVVAWKISEITRDYKKFPDFLDQVQKYDDFCNEPNWNGTYQRVINNCFNLCEPLKWQPKEGSIATSTGFLKHIFQGAGTVQLDDTGKFEKEEAALGDPFTVALDYLTIMLKHPKQMLPVPILVSQENGTGKSTFLKWLQMIWGSNMCILGNAQFQMKFNGHYITKFIIAIDEGFLEVDKKAEKERLKQLVTADSVYLENKGMNVRKIIYYGKVIICSNDADRVMKIEDGESRWFVVKVPVIPKEKMDPDLEIKLKKEVEAFLNFLHNRQVFHPRSHRLWFDPEHFITDQYRVIVEATKNRIDRVVEGWVREQFLQFKEPVLRYTTSYLVQIFNDPKQSKYKVDELDLKKFLADRGMKPEKESIYFKTPKGFKEVIYTEGDANEPLENSQKVYWAGTGRPFIFRAEQWLSHDELIASGLVKTQTGSDDVPF